MKAKTFSKYLAKLEATASRNEITAILANLFSQSSAKEIDKICYLSLGRLVPQYQSLEFNLAEKTMSKILAYAFQKSEKEIIEEFKKSGDLGNIAYNLTNSTRGGNLNIIQLHQQLSAIARQTGTGSQTRKTQLFSQLIHQLADPLTSKYLVRITIGKLRLGFSDLTILDALSWMKTGNKELRPSIEKTYNISADIGLVAKVFKQGGIKALKKIRPRVGIPIRPALTERLNQPEKIIEKLGQPAIEPKYDGFRVQIHFNRAKKIVRIFSRRMENTTVMFPEIVAAVQKLPAKSAILDGEAIGINPKTGKFLAFQETAQRKRKYKIKEAAKKTPLNVFVFDVLYLNNKSLLEKPFFQRRQLLEKLLAHQRKILKLTPQKIVKTAKELEKLFYYWVNRRLEGIVCKKTGSFYQAGKRDFTWVKYKRAMKSHLADTVDCLVMGYYRGRGRRSTFGIGAFLAGVWDPKKEIFITIAKIGTGLTDKQWREIRQRVDKINSKKKPGQYFVPKALIPDIWASPGLVVEILADEITKSPLHSSNLALRFPRMQRFRDKKPTDITSLPEIKKLYKMQKQ